MSGDGISIPLEVVDHFSGMLGAFEAAARGSFSAAQGEMAKLADGSARAGTQFSDFGAIASVAFADVNLAATGATSVLEEFSATSSTAARQGSDDWRQFADSLADMLSSAGDLFSDFWGTVQGLASSAIGSLASAVPVVGSLLSRYAGDIVKAIASALSGPTNEELLAGAGETMARRWGSAFSDEAARAMAKVAESLPKAGSGKYDVVFASYHPETLRAILNDLTEFGQATQRALAESIGNGVNYLRDKLHISHAEAFAMMAPVFAQAVERALQFGETLNPEMLALIEHAKNLGVAIEVDADKFADALQGFIASGALSVESLENLRTLAGQVGVDIDALFADVLDRFIESEEFSMAKLEDIARAATAAGYEIGDALGGAMAGAEQKLAELQGRMAEFGRDTLDWFADKFRLQDEKQSAKANVIDQLAGKDASAEERNTAQQRYNELLEKARKIEIDGLHDRRDIRAELAGLIGEEKRIVVDLAQQRQERLAHKEALKQQKEEEKRVREQIQAQKDLIEQISALVASVAAGFGGVGAQIPVQDTQRFADDIHAAYLDWKYMVDNPISAQSSGGTTFSGAGGFDYLFSGPATGYTMPVTLHGTERLTAIPNGHSAGAGNTIIIQPALTINALDARSIRDRGTDIANAVAAAVKRGVTDLHSTIVRK